MSEEQDRSLPHETELAEIELSDDELRSVVLARRSPASVAVRTVRTVATPAPPVVEAAPVTAAVRRRGPWRPAAAIAGLGSVLALAAMIGYQNLRPAAPPPLPATVVAQVDEPSRTTNEAENRTPVLVRNPFDKSEVFEFPPGTTEQEAHAAVADTLLERARERQAQYDARHPKRRRSG